MSDTLMLILVFLLGAVLGIGAYLVIQSRIRRNRLTAAREKAASIVQRAEKEAESRLEAAALEAKLHVEATEAKLKLLGAPTLPAVLLISRAGPPVESMEGATVQLMVPLLMPIGQNPHRGITGNRNR